MPRLAALEPSAATGKAKGLLDAVQKTLGMTPNMTRTFAASPAALEAYVAFNGALARGLLDARVREQIALTVAEANGCDYCLSAHTALGGRLGLAADALERSRHAQASDPKVQGALVFARAVVDSRGDVSDADLADVRAAGYSDGEIAEIVANVAINVFTNYFNQVARTEVDFPRVSAREAPAGGAGGG